MIKLRINFILQLWVSISFVSSRLVQSAGGSSMDTLGMKSIWCSIPLIRGSLGGTCTRNMSSSPHNRDIITLGKVWIMSLVAKIAILYRRTRRFLWDKELTWPYFFLPLITLFFPFNLLLWSIFLLVPIFLFSLHPIFLLRPLFSLTIFSYII